MAIQVNIFNSGSVPTATELANFINALNTELDSIVTINTEQVIEGAKTFWGSKMLKFKQKASADKLGFTFYDYQGKEVGNFEYDNKNNFRLLALGNYYSAANQEIEGHVGFKVYNKSASAAYRLLCPLAGNAKNSIPTLSETYTNFYMPLVFTNGAASVTADNNGKVDLSTLIGSGSGGGDISGLATVATTGDYNDLLNRPIIFSGSYNDLTNKPTLFSGSYGDLTDKPTLFSGDYNDLTNKPTIPVVDITKAQADGWYQPIGDYALTTDLFSGSYNDLTDKPSLFSGSYNDLADKPTIPTVPAISTNITSDATSNTKTASPKAVKDFVEGKGYLTQHQDISGKADQTDLEALEDRVETLEQGGSGGSSSITVDTQLNNASTNPIQNKVLYDELRIVEPPTSIVVDGVTYPVVVINLNTLPAVRDMNGDGGTPIGPVVTVIPELDSSKAYLFTNSKGKNIVFIREEQNVIFKFAEPYYDFDVYTFIDTEWVRGQQWHTRFLTNDIIEDSEYRTYVPWALETALYDRDHTTFTTNEYFYDEEEVMYDNQQKTLIVEYINIPDLRTNVDIYGSGSSEDNVYRLPILNPSKAYILKGFDANTGMGYRYPFFFPKVTAGGEKYVLALEEPVNNYAGPSFTSWKNANTTNRISLQFRNYDGEDHDIEDLITWNFSYAGSFIEYFVGTINNSYWKSYIDFGKYLRGNKTVVHYTSDNVIKSLKEKVLELEAEIESIRQSLS